MIADSWKTARIALLGTTFAGVLLVLVKSIFYPASSDRSVSAFDFPQTVPLSGWQQIKATPLPVTEDALFLSGAHYQYLQEDRSLDIRMYYVTVGNASGLQDVIKKYGYENWVQNQVEMRQDKNIGFYGFWQKENRVNLAACINPIPRTTLTGDQFGQMYNSQAFQLGRIIPWLLGKAPLRDSRCLWTTLSLPIETGKSPQEIYPVLEQVWFSWYEWWQPRFPQR